MTRHDNLNPKTLQTELMRVIQDTGSYYAGMDWLIAQNNKQGYRYCKGRYRFDPVTRLPKIGYCGRWHCWKCGEKRLQRVTARIVAGAETIAATGRLWFVTLKCSDSHQYTTALQWREATEKLITALRNKAAREGVELAYCHAAGFKPTTGQIHSHLLLNWLPEPEPVATAGSSFRYVDTWLDPRAGGVDLVAWIEHAQHPTKVARYMAKNIASTLPMILPKGFRRVVFGSRWPEPATPPDTLHSFTPKKSEIHTAPAAPIQRDLFNTPLPPTPQENSIERHTMETKTCPKCHQEKPLTKEYWQRDRTKPDGWHSNCSACRCKLDRKRDKVRDRQPWRQLQRRVIGVNNRAVAAGVEGRLTPQDVESIKQAAGGRCYWCGGQLGSRWHVDHVRPVSRGGVNTAENVVCTCASCNSKKGNLPVSQWYQKLGAAGIRHQDAPPGTPVQLRLKAAGGFEDQYHYHRDHHQDAQPERPHIGGVRWCA